MKFARFKVTADAIVHYYFIRWTRQRCVGCSRFDIGAKEKTVLPIYRVRVTGEQEEGLFYAVLRAGDGGLACPRNPHTSMRRQRYLLFRGFL